MIIKKYSNAKQYLEPANLCRPCLFSSIFLWTNTDLAVFRFDSVQSSNTGIDAMIDVQRLLCTYTYNTTRVSSSCECVSCTIRNKCARLTKTFSRSSNFNHRKSARNINADIQSVSETAEPSLYFPQCVCGGGGCVLISEQGVGSLKKSDQR